MRTAMRSKKSATSSHSGQRRWARARSATASPKGRPGNTNGARQDGLFRCPQVDQQEVPESNYPEQLALRIRFPGVYLYSLRLDDGTGSDRDVEQWFAHPLLEGHTIKVEGQSWRVVSASLREDWAPAVLPYRQGNRGTALC